MRPLRDGKLEPAVQVLQGLHVLVRQEERMSEGDRHAVDDRQPRRRDRRESGQDGPEGFARGQAQATQFSFG